MQKIDAQITPTPSGRVQCLREASWLGARRVDTKLAGVRHCEVGLRSARFCRSSEGDLCKCLYENELFDTFAQRDFFDRHFIVSRKSQRSREFCSLERKSFSSSAQRNAGRRPIGSTAPLFSPISVVVMSAAEFFVLLVSFPGRWRCSRYLDGLPTMRTVKRHLGIHQSIMKTHVHAKLSTHAYMQPRLCHLHKHLYFLSLDSKKKGKRKTRKKDRKIFRLGVDLLMTAAWIVTRLACIISSDYGHVDYDPVCNGVCTLFIMFTEKTRTVLHCSMK